MKKFIALTFIFQIFTSFSQSVVPFVDFNDWFRTVKDGAFQFIDMQQIEGYQAGDSLVAYFNIQGNLMVYDGIEKQQLSNMQLQYQVSDNIVGWNIGTTLQMWEDGQIHTLNYFAGNYVVKDHLLVFVDTRFNAMQVFWNGNTYPLYRNTIDIDLKNSQMIGQNIMAYEGNGGLYSIFYKGQNYEAITYNGEVDFKAGTDIIAFNDPLSQTFAVFDHGEFLDVESQWVNYYKAARGFVVYEDINNNLKLYQNGQTKLLSSFPGRWDAVDDIAVYEKNGFTYCYVNGVETQVANYKLEEYKIKNGTIVYRNMMGGVNAIVNGKLVELTNLQNAEYEIYGNSVLVKLPNKRFIVYQNGKKLTI